MDDETTTFQELKDKVLRFSKDRNWIPYHTPKNLAMALSVEASELLEHFQWSTPEESLQIVEDAKKKAEVAEELADIAIYALQFANQANIDLAKSIELKIKKNAVKYPLP